MENVKAAMENAGSAGKAEAINYQSVKQKFQSYCKRCSASDTGPVCMGV